MSRTRSAARGRTRVAILGAGPAGLFLTNALKRHAIECVVFERSSREHVETRTRAGLVEQRTVESLCRYGLAEGLLAAGTPAASCEFRHLGARLEVSFAELGRGDARWGYPQQNLVRDLLAAHPDVGDIHFGSRAVAVDGLDTPSPMVTYQAGTRIAELACDFVIGCDGSRGLARQVIPEGARRTSARDYGIDWLSLLASAPPSAPGVVYGLHPDGFAGHFPRSRDTTRYFLQIPAGDRAENWTDDDIWSRLERRLALGAGPQLISGPVAEKSVLHLRSAVTFPMRFGRLFLAGDAAHLLTPAGGQGMNLAIADADLLASALIGHYRDHDDALLDAYSASRMPDVRRAAEFSDRMLRLMHGTTGTDPLSLIEHGHLGARPGGATRLRGTQAGAKRSKTTALHGTSTTSSPRPATKGESKHA